LTKRKKKKRKGKNDEKYLHKNWQYFGWSLVCSQIIYLIGGKISGSDMAGYYSFFG
jgi:hypothetical protein